jgi:hypothetical protein
MNTLKATLVLTLLLGCASPRPALRADRTPARLTDTPAEKMAAMPVPDPTADPENKDQRYGIESARAREETARQKREQKRRCVDVVARAEAAKGKPICVPASK